MSAPVDVAVAVLIRSDGAALLAQRPASKVYSGYWEFPGGKIEPGEPVAEALGREIREELGIEIERAYPWITRVFTYPHAKVRLHFYRVTAWRGEPRALEHQAIAWQRPDAVELDPLLPANGPVIRNLMLPPEYAITRAGELGAEPFLSRLEARLRGGLKLIQVREKTLAPQAAAEFARRALALARAHGAKILVNSDAALAREIGADGVHLTAEQLRSATARPDFPWCGAFAPGRGPARLGTIPADRRGRSGAGLRARRDRAARSGASHELRRARHRHGAGSVGKAGVRVEGNAADPSVLTPALYHRARSCSPQRARGISPSPSRRDRRACNVPSRTAGKDCPGTTPLALRSAGSSLSAPWPRSYRLQKVSSNSTSASHTRVPKVLKRTFSA